MASRRGWRERRTCKSDTVEYFAHEAEDNEYTGVHKSGDIITNTLRAHICAEIKVISRNRTTAAAPPDWITSAQTHDAAHLIRIVDGVCIQFQVVKGSA